jgi:hypothetical protein
MKFNFPKYERVATVGTVTKGTALVPAEVSMTENKATGETNWWKYPCI